MPFNQFLVTARTAEQTCHGGNCIVDLRSEHIQIRRSVPPTTFQSLVVTLVLSRLDYGNAILVGLPAYLHGTSSAVGTECGSTADLSHEIRGSHHRCSCLPPLAVRPGADRFQGRCADVQSFTWKCAAVSVTIRCCCQSARPTDITLWWHQSSDCAIRQTFNSR